MKSYPKITISFKQEEMWMYNIIKQHSSKGAYIKDLLSKAIKEEQGQSGIDNKNTLITNKNTLKMDDFLNMDF